MSYSNGIICFGSDRECLVMNSTIGSYKVLPRLSEERLITTFIGFSPSISKFKVLAMSKSHYKLGFGNHMVLTMENQECLWDCRPVECQIDHEPETASNMSPVCINEDLYYETELHVPGSSMAIAMISFSLKTEAFVSYQIPDTSVSRHSHCETGPFNIRGKVGISFA
ncbi:unnamed protein product [Brassica oleracea]